MSIKFQKKFTQQESIPDEAINSAIEVLKSGRLHRYNVVDSEDSETSLFESEYANYNGSKYALSCASGGYAMHISLCAFGLQRGEPVLTNAFTLSPVPGAIHNAGGKSILIETTEDLVIDLKDLEQKITSSGSRILMLSHMRGHIVDMDALCKLLKKYEVTLIEDCAHTMGAKWGGKRSGTFGLAGCFSTQSYKHMNSGEGGIVVSDNRDFIARAIILSGSYQFYGKHLSAPKENFIENISLIYPNYSGRMDNLRASILRPQLRLLKENCNRWNKRYRVIESILQKIEGIVIPERTKKEDFVGSSIQFRIPSFSPKASLLLVERCRKRGVVIKWFGNKNPVGYTSNHKSWNYLDYEELPNTDLILSTLFDLRIPLTFTIEDCKLISEIICECLLDIQTNKTSP
ncbi:aminotransferase class I/II-fold pyridoxal phosphate-dependent enzyme [Croceitalea sp. MTPC9]|uniref:DegT/DnrJ/EryC1/StrS family aminotransferase n=1 Tax=unclassified Croceitalea TaxID=2632280 RepID=UPI002B38A470|nr:aminotransferase class I/II-fold pyridoxal phosphate-dependent enzyme [Croceitalea sp. MTPC6]GMN16136.1 aminotransferase class I/II-fold pyridoxal phosphate-dependent enzyme [Croceitalea sp. MTPC9]